MSSVQQSNEKNLQILKILFEKAINMSEFDLLLIDVICTLLHEDPKLVDNLYEIFAKIIKKNVSHIHLSRKLEILAECIMNGGELFRDKILEENLLRECYNAIIEQKIDEKDIKNKLKNKFIEYILLWKIIYPNIDDFKKLYDKILMKNNKKVKSKKIDSEKCATDRFEKSDFNYLETIDNVKISFNHKNLIDLKSANLIIQYHLNQNKREQLLIEAQKNRLDELKKDIKDLNEMINKKNRSSDNIKFMKEIYEHCSFINLIFEKLPIFVAEENSKETENEEDIVLLRDEAIKISDDLREVMKNYENLHISNDDSDEDEEQEKETEEKQDELNDFSLLEIEKETNTSQKEISNPSVNKILIDNLISLSEVPLNPITLHNKHKNENSVQILNEKPENLSICQKKLDEPKHQDDFRYCIEKKVDKFFKEHLKDERRIGKFEKKKTEKISINEMKNKKFMTIEDSGQCNKTLLTTANDDTFTSDEEEKLDNDEQEIKLSDISLDMTSIKKDPNLRRKKIKGHKSSINKDNIYMYFQFTENRPKKNVSAIVISIINRGQSAITDIHLEAAVQKPCKLRLLKPGKTFLPGVSSHQNPIFDVEQILLLYNPTKQSANITFILSYKYTNNDDEISDLITTIIPYTE